MRDDRGRPVAPPGERMANTLARAYSAAHFALVLGEKEIVGFPRSVEGGNFKAEIMTYQWGDSHAILRQLGAKPKIEDLKFQVGMGMGKTFYSWLEGFFTGEVTRKHGSIISGDFHYKERARRDFKDALISGIQFPKLSADDKNAAYMTVTVTPEDMEFKVGDGAELDHNVGPMVQKLWTAANFRFSIDGFDQACERTVQVDAIDVKQKILEYPAGNLRQPLRVPGPIEWPNITFYIPEVDAGPFIDHFKKRIVDGELQTSRLTGAIRYLDIQREELARVDIYGIDIASIEPDKSDTGSDDLKKVKIQISVERLKFVWGEVAKLE